MGLATAGGLAEIAAGVLGTVATWVASTGSRAAGREAQTPRLVGACERQARVFLGGALRCLACIIVRLFSLLASSKSNCFLRSCGY